MKMRLIALLLCLSLSTRAHAAQTIGPTGSTSGLLTTVAVLVAGVVIFLQMQKNEPKPAPTNNNTPNNTPNGNGGGYILNEQQLQDAAMAYLSSEGAALFEDASHGGGDATHDLARALAIPAAHVPRFDALLRAHAGELRMVANASTLRPNDAVSVLRHLGELLSADPLLADDFHG